jgi:hypothetical protein
MGKDGFARVAAEGAPGDSPDTGYQYQRDVLAASRRAPPLKRPELDGRRPAATLRRVKDSKEELRRTRARGASSGTVESSTTNSGRSFTVANINHGIIYLRYVRCPKQWLWSTVCLCAPECFPAVSRRREGAGRGRDGGEEVDPDPEAVAADDSRCSTASALPFNC